MRYSLRAIFIIMTIGAVVSCYVGMAYRQAEFDKLPRFKFSRPKWLPEQFDNALVQRVRKTFLERAVKSALPEAIAYRDEARRQQELIRNYVEGGFEGSRSRYHSYRPVWLPADLDIWLTQRVRYCHVSGSLPAELSKLANFPNIEEVSLSAVSCDSAGKSRQAEDWDDLSPLAEMRHLKKLWIEAKRIGDLTPLAKLTHLDLLSLDGLEHPDLTPVKGLVKLKELYLQGEQVANLADLSNLKNLERFSFLIPDLRDISGMSKLRNLKHLEMFSEELNDISALSGVENLTSLSVWGTKIRDLSPLVNLTHLSYVDVSLTQLSDVSAIMHCKRLKSLSLNDTAVTLEDVERLRQQLPGCRIYYR